MNKMKELTIQELNLPAYMPLQETFGVEPFAETKKGKKLLETVKIREKIANLIHIVTIILALGFAVMNYFGVNNGKILQAVVSGGLLYGVGALIKFLYTMFMISPAQTKYVDKRNDYASEFGHTIMHHFGGHLRNFGNGFIFLVNADLCLYVNTEYGEWIGYDKNSIKSVELSHVLIGSSTVSQTSSSGVGIAWTSNIGTYQGSSSTHSKTTSHYEWRFDVFTGFMNYPKLTLVFPDDTEGEDFAKIAKAILS